MLEGLKPLRERHAESLRRRSYAEKRKIGGEEASFGFEAHSEPEAYFFPFPEFSAYLCIHSAPPRAAP